MIILHEHELVKPIDGIAVNANDGDDDVVNGNDEVVVANSVEFGVMIYMLSAVNEHEWVIVAFFIWCDDIFFKRLFPTDFFSFLNNLNFSNFFFKYFSFLNIFIQISLFQSNVKDSPKKALTKRIQLGIQLDFNENSTKKSFPKPNNKVQRLV